MTDVPFGRVGNSILDLRKHSLPIPDDGEAWLALKWPRLSNKSVMFGENTRQAMKLGNRIIDHSAPAFIVAELSGNHRHSYKRAEKMVHVAAEAGVDAIKLQTYTADSLTIKCSNEFFQIKEGPWKGKSLYELYEEAYTPWKWQPKLKKLGNDLGIEVFSTPFDRTAVDFLENDVGVNVYKVASFEIVDIPLLEKISSTKKPVIISTGMATLEEIENAVRALRKGGTPSIALLKCVSSYPAMPEQMNLATIPHMAQAFDCVAGLSDHTLSPAVSVAAVVLGARIIEKHFTLARSEGGPDAMFSLEPEELKQTVEMIRHAEASMGEVVYGAGLAEQSNIIFRKSIFVTEDMDKGATFTKQNIRVIRPGYGLAPAELSRVMGRKASLPIKSGTPLNWEMIGSKADE